MRKEISGVVHAWDGERMALPFLLALCLLSLV